MTDSSKKLTASFAALQILLYHCWIPVFQHGTFLGEAERFLIASTFSGVDIFFFISAYSLVSNPVEHYWHFIQSRVVKLLPLFFIAWIAGHFLWFLPSIMIVYLVLPPLVPLCQKRPTLSFFLLMIGWVGIVFLILGIIRPVQDYGIFLFRIPSVFLGAYAVKFREKFDRRKAFCAGILLLAVGTFLVYRYGYLNKLSVPFRSTFYLMGIPNMLGTVLLLDHLAAGHSFRIIDRFGSMTLELYFSQMVFGTCLVSLFFYMTRSRIVTNFAVMAVITTAAAIIKFLNDRFKRLFQIR